MATTVKHLPGHHDQKSHGRAHVRGSANASPQDVADIAELLETSDIPADHLEGFDIVVVAKGSAATAGKVGKVASSTVTVPRRGPNGKKLSEGMLKDVLAHEVGHQVWHRKLSEADRVDWEEAAKQIRLTSTHKEIARAFPYLQEAAEASSAPTVPKDRRNYTFAGEAFAELYGAYHGPRKLLVKKYFPVRYRKLESLHKEELLVAKHLPGKHDQKLHGRGLAKYGDAGQAKQPANPLADPDSEINVQARVNWPTLSHAQRMALLDPDAINESMARELGRYREKATFVYQPEGKLTPTSIGQIRGNAYAYLKQIDPALTPHTRTRLREFVESYDQTLRRALEDGSLPKDVKADYLNDMMLDNLDKLTYQEIESRKRQLGDHGIRHVVGNIENAQKMLDEFPNVTGLDRLMVTQAMVEHDMGYTAGVVTKSFEATKVHEAYSAKWVESQDYAPLFGDQTGRLRYLVATHAEFDLDWKNDPVVSAVRTADNLALFQRDKLPALFLEVPQATTALARLQLAKVAGEDQAMLPQIQKDLHRYVDESMLDDRIKAELHQAADEVFPATSKFALGMLAGEVEGFQFDGELMNVELGYKPERDVLNGLFDLGDRQFEKFLENYDQEGGASGGTELHEKDSGERVLRMTFTDRPTRLTNPELFELESISVRPVISKLRAGLGEPPDLDLMARSEQNIRRMLRDRLTEDELKDFTGRLERGQLADFPLTAKERAYMRGEALKHLPGRHDQKSHGRGGVGKEPEGIVYYRGTVPGSQLRIRTGVESWDENLFVTETERGAKLYGEQVEKIVLSPETRLLREGGKGWSKAPKWKVGMNMLEWASSVADWAKEHDYDAVHFQRQTDVGTVILNPEVVIYRAVLKHLPGKHDQQTHDPHKGGSIPKVSGSYDPNPNARRNSSNYAGGGSYREVDGAVQVPVKYLNEVLHIPTFASCEGHEREWMSSGGVLGYRYDDNGKLIGDASQSSYIATHSYRVKAERLAEMLRTKGFEEGSTARKIGPSTRMQLYRNNPDGKTHLVYDYDSDGTLAFRVATGVIDMSKAKPIKFDWTEEFKNSSDSYEGQSVLSQAEWDAARDVGWEAWMGLLTEFEQ